MQRSRAKQFIFVAAAAVLLAGAAFSANTAFAAKGGGGGHKGGGQTGGGVSSCTLTVSPNPVPAMTYYSLNGSGFIPNDQLNIDIDGVRWVMFSDANGNLYVPASSRVLLADPGSPTNTIIAKESTGSGLTQCGSITFPVT